MKGNSCTEYAKCSHKDTFYVLIAKKSERKRKETLYYSVSLECYGKIKRPI